VVEPLQCRGGIGTELVGQPPPDLLELGQSVGLAAAVMTLAEIPQSRSAKFPTLGTKGMVGL